jgi:hypothetical protein
MPNFIDLIGERFGRLTVPYRGVNDTRAVVWVCSCDCAPESKIHIKGVSLRSGTTRSCGCLRSQRARERGVDLAGWVVGQWTVLRQAPNRGYRRYWLCRCSCGIEREVAANNLCDGKTRCCRDCWASRGASRPPALLPLAA